MPAAINTDAEIIAYANGSGVPVAAADVTDANTKATDMIRQAALNCYTSATFELLTTANTPPEMKQMHCYLALGVLSDGDAARPASVDERWKEAKMYLGFLVSGKTHYDRSPGAVLVKHAESFVTYKAPAEKVFDRNNVSQNFNRRDEPI